LLFEKYQLVFEVLQAISVLFKSQYNDGHMDTFNGHLATYGVHLSGNLFIMAAGHMATYGGHMGISQILRRT
jgi:hypothetical protein